MFAAEAVPKRVTYIHSVDLFTQVISTLKALSVKNIFGQAQIPPRQLSCVGKMYPNNPIEFSASTNAVESSGV